MFAAAVAACLLISPQHRLLPYHRALNYFDLRVYRGGARSVLDGLPLYDARISNSYFTYPPASALLFAPLAAIPLAFDEVLTTGISIALLVGVLWFALHLEPISSWLKPRQAAALALLGAAAALWLEPVFTTIGYGQIDLLIVALIVFDLSLPDTARAKGVCIGLAAGLKLTPTIFVLYLLVTERRRAAARALCSLGATIALGFLLVPRDAGRYWGGLLFDSSRVGRLENSANQSLRGALARMLHTPDVQAWWWVVAALVGLAGLSLAVIVCRRGDEATGFSLCALTGLLVSPVSWTHHWVLAVPALLLFGVVAYRRRSRARLLAGLALAATGYSHLTWLVHPGAASELHLGFAGMLYGNAYVLIGLVALATAAWLISRRRPGASLTQ